MAGGDTRTYFLGPPRHNNTPGGTGGGMAGRDSKICHLGLPATWVAFSWLPLGRLITLFTLEFSIVSSLVLKVYE